MIRDSTAAYARSMAFTPPTVPNAAGSVRAGPGGSSGGPGWLTQAAERVVAPALPGALATVREERETADVEARREAGQILEDRVEGVARHVLGDRDVRVVREPGVPVDRLGRGDRGGQQLALADADREGHEDHL